MRLLLVLALLVFAHGSALANEIKISTNDLVYAQLFKKIQPGFEKSSGITLKFITDVSGKGPTMSATDVFRHVATGQAEVGAAAFGVEDWKKSAEKEADLKSHLDKITFRVIGKDRLAVVAHKGVTVQGVSKDQLAGIFSGEIKNWSELKGPAIPIVPARQAKTIARDKFFKKTVFDDKKDFAANVAEISGYDAIFDYLAKTPGSVIFLPESYASGRDLSVIRIPEMGRPINMITVGKPSDNVMKLVAYIKNNGG